jgi:hypothetical protein
MVMFEEVGDMDGRSDNIMLTKTPNRYVLAIFASPKISVNSHLSLLYLVIIAEERHCVGISPTLHHIAQDILRFVTADIHFLLFLYFTIVVLADTLLVPFRYLPLLTCDYFLDQSSAPRTIEFNALLHV